MGKAVNVSVSADSKSIRSTDENERLIRKFSKKVKKSGLMDELRERRYFNKKSIKRKLKKILILGLTYKANVSDIRNSLAFTARKFETCQCIPGNTT